MDGFICFLSVLVTIILLSLYPFRKYVTKQIIQHQNLHIYSTVFEFDRNSKIKPLKHAINQIQINHAYEPVSLYQYGDKKDYVEPLQVIIC